MSTIQKRTLPPLPGKVWDVIRRGRDADSTAEPGDGMTINLLRDLVRSLQADNERLGAENADLRQKLSKKKLKVGPPQHPGQLSIEEEAK